MSGVTLDKSGESSPGPGRVEGRSRESQVLHPEELKYQEKRTMDLLYERGGWTFVNTPSSIEL